MASETKINSAIAWLKFSRKEEGRICQLIWPSLPMCGDIAHRTDGMAIRFRPRVGSPFPRRDTQISKVFQFEKVLGWYVQKEKKRRRKDEKRKRGKNGLQLLFASGAGCRGKMVCAGTSVLASWRAAGFSRRPRIPCPCQRHRRRAPTLGSTSRV